MKSTKLLFLVFFLLPWQFALAQTGKVAGTVTDDSGTPLPGVNVVIEGTTQGATTDADGFYTILNVSPGVYAVRASFIGFTPQVVEDVRVNIDLTTDLDFALQEETVGLEEVVVTAQEPIVRRDISANVANLDAEQFENLPVSGVEGVIGLQAGIEPGMSIRGGSLDEIAFQVDGLSMRSGRSNAAFTGISFTSVEQVQVQTGGFNAEYGNVRAGLVNVVTKDPPRNRYTVDAMMRYTPAYNRSFDGLASDPDEYWMRPFLDPEVAFTGTSGAQSPWDRYTQRSYHPFNGWNRVAKDLADNEEMPDLTPEELVELFKWRHRKDVSIDAPDYEADVTVGGPLLPGARGVLGDLRFLASYRGEQEMYFIPQRRDRYTQQTGQLKLISNLTPSMKLVVQGLLNEEEGMNAGAWPGNGIYEGELAAYPWSYGGLSSDIERGTYFTWDRWSLADTRRFMLGGKLTHTLSASTFYEVALQRMATEYDTYQPPKRDTSAVKFIGGVGFDEAPYGWWGPATRDFSQLQMSGHWAQARDTSHVVQWSSRFDLTSQLNRYSQMKAGVEVIYADYNMKHAVIDSFQLAPDNPIHVWRRQPVQGAAYVQNKLEFQGMVANLGVRADLFSPGGDWWAFDTYTRAFTSRYQGNLDELLESRPTKTQFALSPRLGISFPITEGSKLFFNYGHFRQMLDPNALFRKQTTYIGRVSAIGNPNHPMPKTVAYELGYEHNLFDRFLLRLSGYYRDIRDQPRSVQFVSIDGLVSYSMSLPKNYEDIRGLEVTLSKNTGKWVRGFVNYTYMARKSGNFGFGYAYENDVEQRRYELESSDYYQWLPVPEPFARLNLEFLVPQDFGPQVAGARPLGDWRLNVLGDWRAGQTFTWSGGPTSYPNLRNNVRWKDYYNVDLRLSKTFNTGFGSAMFFLDMKNALNLRHLYRNDPFEGPQDWEHYMWSLHLPEDTFEELNQDPYLFIPGNDRPGDFRKPGVEWVPIEVVPALPASGYTRTQGHYGPLYYAKETESYHIWDAAAGAWRAADPAKVEQVLEDKAYIDMPNEGFRTFLNPRHFIFGIRVTL